MSGQKAGGLGLLADLLEDAQDFVLAQDQVFFPVDFDFRARIFPE
jgi:hypothetical protein